VDLNVDFGGDELVEAIEVTEADMNNPDLLVRF
jgi:hypothetical protein